ncbi:plasmid mobilization relaxosome protein MobC [Chryseobacterium limigenitum]|uniref:Mobilisation protein (MobC) n=1 Tax=Chryseobacterium limigenitum TaxID=1612149 RepID=A0A1K2IWW8_9FLAO|nr:plasmid mobilization relaxosome protein MobC [Chryseobacterium limigenitum]SFZ96929.1 mobilisation protein (MobC) [Chryseobacterium limigenitum]
MENFRTYLLGKGLSHLQGAERKKIYAEYKREYVRNFMKQKRSKHQVIELFLTEKDYERLTKTAQHYGLSRSSFCQQLVLSNISDTVWIPNQQLISELQISIKKIGNNINQIARIANSKKELTHQLWEEAYQKLHQLEELIKENLSHPELFVKT